MNNNYAYLLATFEGDYPLNPKFGKGGLLDAALSFEEIKKLEDELGLQINYEQGVLYVSSSGNNRG